MSEIQIVAGRFVRRLMGSETTQAEFIRMAVGLFQFFVLARALSVEAYGRLALIYVLASFLVPVLTMSATTAAVRRRAAGETAAALRTRCVRTAAWSTIVVIAVVFATQTFLPASPIVVAALVVSETVAASTVQGMASVAQGAQDFVRYRRYIAAMAVGRLAAVTAFTLLGSHELRDWAGLVLFAALSSGAWALIDDRLHWRRSPEMKSEKVGRVVHRPIDTAVMATNALSSRLLDDADKAIISFFASYEAVAVYTVSYRVASYVLFPVRAVLGKFMPAFFAAGANDPGSIPGQIHRARTDLARMLLVTVPVLMVAAFFIPEIFGGEYGTSRYMGIALIPALMLRGYAWILGDVLVAVGRPHLRLFAQIISLIIPVGACVLLVFYWGSWGAVLATLLGEATAILALSVLTRFVLRGELIDAKANGEGMC